MHKYRINILYINCDALKLSYNQYVNIYSQNRKTTILFLVFYFFIYKTDKQCHIQTLDPKNVWSHI